MPRVISIVGKSKSDFPQKGTKAPQHLSTMRERGMMLEAVRLAQKNIRTKLPNIVEFKILPFGLLLSVPQEINAL